MGCFSLDLPTLIDKSIHDNINIVYEIISSLNHYVLTLILLGAMINFFTECI